MINNLTDNELLPLATGDPWLEPFDGALRARQANAAAMAERLTGGRVLADFAAGHEYFGLHRTPNGGWVMREWAPAAISLHLIGPFSQWRPDPAFAMRRINEQGIWEAYLAEGVLSHAMHYKLWMAWPGGAGERIPAWTRRVVQDEHTKVISAQVWDPAATYSWRYAHVQRRANAALIYEAHVGMAQEESKVGTYREFRERVLPRIVDAGYNTLQLMAIAEHPYYGSFGYHVSSFFAASSRFGTPEELKELVDAAHGAGLAVIMDLVHSHAVKNEIEGLSCFDGTLHQYFHAGPRGQHVAWDSRCFDYGKPEVLHFLLSNCRFWLDEYHFDGYRFDGVTSMIYLDHGLGRPFGNYADYFNGTDEDAIAYLTLANRLIHSVCPDALTVAEDVSGLPGLAAPESAGGVGFDYRLAMGIPDFWIKLIKEMPDERWDVARLYHELTNRRRDERSIGYAESHDQALVGDKTIAFRLMDAAMYTHMSVVQSSLLVDRGMALHKMIRLVTLATAGHGYLNFMGNEFGHPEWIDFPREGNGWSCYYARRQWSLRNDPDLRYRFLAEFDKAMLALVGRAGQGLDAAGPQCAIAHTGDQVLAFARGRRIFVFNFSPDRSFTDYGVPVAPGNYRLKLDSDSPDFGGHGRVAPGQCYLSEPVREGRRTIRHQIKLYLPTRTALVLEERL
ncbi:MAG: alpha amylase C-terminal domain-containing protein [bacterium]